MPTELSNDGTQLRSLGTSLEREPWEESNNETDISSEPGPNAVDSLLPISKQDQIIALAVGFGGIFQTIGPNSSYGVFQRYLSSSESPLPPDEASSRAMIALIGTLGAGLTWGGSIAVHPLMNRVGNNKLIVLAGGLIMTSAFLLASISSRFWQLLLSQGLTYGVGSSLVWYTVTVVAGPYFNTRRGAAIGFILSAAGVGGLVYSLAIQALLESIGFRWTLRAMALENTLVCIPLAIYARKDRTAEGTRSIALNMRILKSPMFFLQCAAGLLQAAGNFVPMTFTPEFATVLGYSAGFGATLLAINNGVNSISRVLMGFAADRLGRQNLLVVSVIGSAVSVLTLWLTAAMKVDESSKGIFIGFVLLYSVLAGGYNSLFPATIPDVFGLSAYASVNSFVNFARGIGAAFGSPVGGQILGDSRSGSTAGSVAKALADYRNLIWYDGALLVACSICVVGVRVADAADKKHWRWKA